MDITGRYFHLAFYVNVRTSFVCLSDMAQDNSPSKRQLDARGVSAIHLFCMMPDHIVSQPERAESDPKSKKGSHLRCSAIYDQRLPIVSPAVVCF